VNVSQSENSRTLSSAEGFDEIFEMVKSATESRLGMHRAGLTLVLGDIPNSVGAYHEMGSNAIVMNRNLLRIVEKLAGDRGQLNSYVFMILLHEYLHTLGYTSDQKVRNLSKQIADDYLGEKHVVSEMAVRPLDAFFPELSKFVSFRDNRDFETISKFDTSSTSYIA
jgi:hypothetical protein